LGVDRALVLGAIGSVSTRHQRSQITDHQNHFQKSNQDYRRNPG
jgi:hypothetical protein